MKRLVVIVALALLGIVVPWQLGYDPAMLAAPSDVVIGWTGVRPSPVVAGKPASFETRVQARVALVATVEVVARDGKGAIVWQQRWADQPFKPWQSRTYTGSWTVPAAQATGPYVLTVTAGSARSQTSVGTAAASADLTVTRNLTFSVVKPAAASAPSAVPPTATKTNTPVPPAKTNTPVPPTATAAPPTRTASPVPPTATQAPPAATNTAVPPTTTQAPAAATNTPVPPAATNTAVPPTKTNTAVPPTRTNTPAPPTATAQPPAAGVDLDAEEASFLQILNNDRRSRGMGQVAVNPALQAAASWMAADMAAKGYLSHRDSLGRDPGQRMIAHGYSPYAWMCEIALGGSTTGQQAFIVWQHSPGHNGCMIDPKYVSVGIGRAWGPIDGWRWTVNFGSL